MANVKRLQVDVPEYLFQQMARYIEKVNEKGNLLYSYRIKHLVAESLIAFLPKK